MRKLGNSSMRKTLIWIGASVVALVLVVCVVLVFSDVILNQYGRGKAEREFANAHPGSELRIGELDYTIGDNRLTAQSITLRSSGMMLKTGRISLTGVNWTRVLIDTYALAEVLAQASLEVTNVNVEFGDAHYGIRCAQLHSYAKEIFSNTV